MSSSSSSSSSPKSADINTYDMENVAGHQTANFITVRNSNHALEDIHRRRLPQLNEVFTVTLEQAIRRLFDAYQLIEIERSWYRVMTRSVDDQSFNGTLFEINKKLRKLQKAYGVLYNVGEGPVVCCYCNCGRCRSSDLDEF